MMENISWNQCLDRLEQKYSETDVNTWLRPLQVEEREDGLHLLAPNPIVQEWLNSHAMADIKAHYMDVVGKTDVTVSVEVGSRMNHLRLAATTATQPNDSANSQPAPPRDYGLVQGAPVTSQAPLGNRLDPKFSFESFIEGHSNQLALAASRQVATNPGESYNPLFLYGGAGLGKTHLMHAIGNHVRQWNPESRIVYMNSERFVHEMVRAMQHHSMDQFKQSYRSLDILLIDDIQFLAGKDRSQEEFFHTFNSLIETNAQIVLTCDRYPKEIQGLEDRLKSRFGWGLTHQINPPELETRVAILIDKAELYGWRLPDEVAFFIAKRIRANVRELEGALKRVIATADFKSSPITLELTREALRDLLHLQERLVTVEGIQKTVADYYKIRVSDLHSPRRNRSIARPRQVAMALAKELTSHSLPEIGRAFGGRDHTTVLHACRKVASLRHEDNRFDDDYDNLQRILGG